MAWRPPAAWSAVPLLGLLLSAGCDTGDEQLRSLDLGELSERFACDDVTVVAATPDGSEALLVGVEDGLVAAAYTSNEVVEAVYELPDDRLTVRWVSGSNVYGGHCGREGAGAWRLDDRNDAIAGTLAVRLTPTADGVVLSAEFDELVLAPSEALDHPVYVVAPGQLDGLTVD